MRPSSSTRNSASLRFGSTLATAKCPRSALGRLLVLRRPEPSCRATYPFLSLVRCPITWQLASRSTVTGTCSPASVKTRVIPTFCAITPERIGIILCCCPPIRLKPVLELDLDVDAGSEVELHQRIDRLGRRIHDIEESLVGPHLELLTALLVDV